MCLDHGDETALVAHKASISVHAIDINALVNWFVVHAYSRLHLMLIAIILTKVQAKAACVLIDLCTGVLGPWIGQVIAKVEQVKII